MTPIDRGCCISRRHWLRAFADRCLMACAGTGLAGLRFVRYSSGSDVGDWVGWIEWWGKCLGFVDRYGRIFWMRL